MVNRSRSRAIHTTLRRITYKPDWQITLRGNRLMVAVPTWDAASKRRRRVMAGTVRYLPDALLYGKPERLIEYVRAVILRRELHEIDEWLRVDGRHVVDPHPELR